MASIFITNALQVNFESLLGILDNDGMVNMFRALEATGLRGFLGCPSVLYEQELEQFFDTAMVQDGEVTCAVSGKYVAISEDRFAGVFNLSTDGLTDLYEVPNHLVLQARTVFSKSEKPVSYSCNKRLLKYEFRLLNDILAKSITVKAGSFDAVTHERFLMMTAIHFGVNINWSKILVEVLKEMADRTIKRAKGFAAQICVLLKGDPAVTLGEAKTFPTLKILSEKTVNTYVATNNTIDSCGESDEPHVDKVAIVKRKSVSKKKSAPTDKKDADEEPVEVDEKAVSKKRSASTGDEPAVTKKKRTTKKKVALSKATIKLVSVAQDVEPNSVVLSERPHKRTTPKRKLRLFSGSDDEIVAKEPAVEEIIEQEQVASTADDVDHIIARIITETAEMDTEEMIVETDAGKSNETAEATGTNVVMGKADIEELVEPRSEDITVEISEESMSIENLLLQIPGDAMLPSVFAAEPTKIKFGLGIQIPGVTEMDQYKASLPQIAATDKGKDPLVVDTIQGHPAREIFSLICADIEFLIHLREKVIEAVATFFNSFNIHRLPALGSLEAIAAKEEKVLNWGETNSVQIALQRRVYIVANYRELLLRKFLEARRHNFVSGDNIDCGYFIPRNHRTIFSTCWIRTKMLVDGSWLIVEGVDYWRPIMRPVDSRNWEILPQRPYIDDLSPLCAFIEPMQDIDSRAPFSGIVRDHWVEVCVGVIQFTLIRGFALWVDYWRPIMRPVDSRNWEILPQRPYIDDLSPLCAFIEPMQDIDSRAPFSGIVRDHWVEVCVGVIQFTLIRGLRYVSKINRCRDIVGSLVDIEEIPTGFRGLFQRGLNTNSFATFLDDCVEQPEEHVLPGDESSSYDDSVFYGSPSLDAEPSVKTSPVVDITSVPTDFASLSPRNSDISLPFPHQNPSTDTSMHFDTADIPLGTDTAVEQIPVPSTAAPAMNINEQFAQLRTSISVISIKQLRTQSKIGDLQNAIFSKIDTREKAAASY
ncbi:hypothetical protein F511_15007 [Dorcoceras hygrometricum]|uniref:Splicing factor 3B subunit 1-like n=1 Tax=Dorcoceras hygrometricum TaxID=472368 RepID=A0A2Z7CPN5_9LAMI|nr:hypothetical protein F511_15007 [Dorcoceras hygrometricum]